MPIGKGILRRQLAGRGAFAEVELDAEWVEQPVPMSLAPNAELMEGTAYWSTILVAHAIANSRLPKPANWWGPHFLKIEVRKVRTTAADSNDLMVMYVTILAICDALNHSADLLVKLDDNLRTITFQL